MTASPPSISIVGAGVIGLSCAWTLARRGASVTLYDKGQPGLGASWAAAGMLAPAFECGSEPGAHPDLFELCIAGAELWPDFAVELERQTGGTIGYVAGPSVAVAETEEEADALNRMRAALENANTPCEALSPDAAKQMEPALTGPVSAALALPTDGHVDNRAVCEALAAACGAAGVRFVMQRAVEPGEDLGSDVTLWTTGADPTLEGVMPVKGAAFSLRPSSSLPTRAIRFGDVYFTPHADRVVIGATVEPGKTDLEPSREAIGRLHARAAEICDGVESGVLQMRWAGVRPATADHAPMIGRRANGDWIATGHYRNGILLAPITGQIMADMILRDEASSLASAFSPDRFAPATA